MFLTSALCPGVSPVVLLTVCTGLPSKAVTALTLPSELHNREWKIQKRDTSISFESVNVNECERIYTYSILHHEMCLFVCVQVQVFPTSLHEEVTELFGSQPQDSQPLPLARFQWLGAQWSHVRPITFGRHWHWPLARWHTQSSRSIHWLRSVPRKLHVHSEGQKQGHRHDIAFLKQH